VLLLQPQGRTVLRLWLHQKKMFSLPNRRQSGGNFGKSKNAYCSNLLEAIADDLRDVSLFTKVVDVKH
jgi:hypothetical protein